MRHVRKVRVIHTRVPEVLEKELKRLADSLSLPVSNLVRAAIEDAIDFAEAAEVEVEVDMGDARERLERWRKRAERRRARFRAAYRKAHGLDSDESAADDSASDDSEKENVEPGTDPRDEEAEQRSTSEEAKPRGENDAAARDAEIPEGVVGFQPMRLARTSRCQRCDLEMDRGAEAFLGVGTITGPPVIVCPGCAP